MRFFGSRLARVQSASFLLNKKPAIKAGFFDAVE